MSHFLPPHMKKNVDKLIQAGKRKPIPTALCKQWKLIDSQGNVKKSLRQVMTDFQNELAVPQE